MSIKVFIVEDQPNTLKGLVKALEKSPDVTVAGAALDAEGALAGLERAQVDVLILDLELPGMNGLEMLEFLKDRLERVPEVLVWTAFQDEDKVFRAIRDGASGYVLKGTVPSKMIDAIRVVHQGGTVLQPVIARRFLNLFRSMEGGTTDNDCPLDQEELDVLAMVAKGLSSKETGRVLELPQRRVRSRLQNIYKKLAVKGRVDAVAKAIQNGWLKL